MSYKVDDYGSYEEITLSDVRFFGHRDERHFFQLLDNINIKTWIKDDIFINIDKSLHDWQIIELISIFKRYNIDENIFPNIYVIRNFNAR